MTDDFDPQTRELPDCAAETIPDVQGSADIRRLAIDRVGIKDLRHPMIVRDQDGHSVPSVASASMYVDLPHDLKGTHMSRFISLLNEQRQAFGIAELSDMLTTQAQRLDADYAHIHLKFPFFVEKAAPVSGETSLMDYDVEWIGELHNGQPRILSKVVVPVTSLCPCSKKISDYGAHNQRSHVTITVRHENLDQAIGIAEIAKVVEAEAPCELWATLKRPDEKYVTERAYDNPKFVEDMVRDIASRFIDDERCAYVMVESENFESIHNHSAYALIEWGDRVVG
ncbi:MAG: GTP cyclohydrolase FolE2 [Pseudomonadota bacterium]